MGLDGVRSYLFVPASEPERVDKALASAAHAVIVDLEDAVADDAKDGARAVVAAKLRVPRDAGALLVRVNGLETPHATADLAALDGLALDALVVPKAEPAALRALDALDPGGPPVVALVETARGVRAAFDVAAHPRVVATMLGVVDLAAELGITPGPDGRELLHARSALVLDTIAAGRPGPIDGPCLALGDEAALRAETLAAKALGFTAKACIHPAQLAVVHEAFAPSADELAWARRVVDAADEAGAAGRGAVAVDGQMVDAPVVARARRLLAEPGLAGERSHESAASGGASRGISGPRPRL